MQVKQSQFRKQIKEASRIAGHVRRQCGGLPGINDGEIHEAIRRLAGNYEKIIQRFSKIECGPDLIARAFKETFLRSERPVFKLKRGVLRIN